MKIQYEKWAQDPSETLTIEEAFEAEGSWEPSGIAETAQKRAEDAHKALGKLCTILQEKGLLTAKEILDIADMYYHDCRFIDE